MTRAFLALLVLLAAGLPAAADDIGTIMDPTGGRQLYRFESIPSGAAIEYRGVIQFFTDAQFHVDTDYLATVRLLLDGYLPCPFSEGTTGRAKIGIGGSGMKFLCRLVADPARKRTNASGEGPAGWLSGSGPLGPG